MTQEPPSPLGPPPRKVFVRRGVRNARRAYASAFSLMIIVFGGWALMDAFRWDELTAHQRYLTIAFALFALLATLVLRTVDHPLRLELRLGRRGLIAEAEIITIGRTRRRRAAPKIRYRFRTAAGTTIEAEWVLPRRFPIQTLAPA